MDNYLCLNASKNGELTCPQSSLPLFGDRGSGYTESSPPSLIFHLTVPYNLMHHNKSISVPFLWWCDAWWWPPGPCLHFSSTKQVLPSLWDNGLGLTPSTGRLLSSGQVLCWQCPFSNGVPRTKSITLNVFLPARCMYITSSNLNFNWDYRVKLKVKTLFYKSLILRLQTCSLFSLSLCFFICKIYLMRPLWELNYFT